MYHTYKDIIFFFDGVETVIDTHGGTEKRVPNNSLSKVMHSEYTEAGDYLVVPRHGEYHIPENGLYEVYYQQGDTNFVLDQWLEKHHVITFTKGQVVKIRGIE